MTTYTAAIATAADVAGDFCDVCVIVNDESGPEPQLSGETAMDGIELAVRTDDPDKLVKVEDAAEALLGANGWRVTGAWEVADNALYAPAERA